MKMIQYSSPPLSSFPEGMVRFVCELCGSRGRCSRTSRVAMHAVDAGYERTVG
jgi:hypothetical protein